MRTPKNIKSIEKRVKRGQETTFAERNALTVWIKKHRSSTPAVKSKKTVVPAKVSVQAHAKKIKAK